MVNRKFNLGNYETLDLAAEAELNETDNPLEVWNIIRDNIEMQFINMQKPKPKASEPVPLQNPFKNVIASKSATLEPPNQTQSATETFKEETIKYTLAQLNGDIKPIHYINDSELFGRISEDLKTHGYKWISAGRESRWSKQ